MIENNISRLISPLVRHVSRDDSGVDSERKNQRLFQDPMLILLILQLIISILSQLKSDQEPELELTNKQKEMLRSYFGLEGEQGFTVLDKDGDGKISIGDVVSVSGGAGNSIRDITLNERDVNFLTNNHMKLTDTQNQAIRDLFGLWGDQNFVVLDKDNNQKLSVGDVVSVSGGFTGGHIRDIVLTQENIDQLTGSNLHLLGAMDDYIRNKALWDSNRPDKYEFTYQRSGFFLPEYERPIKNTVLGNTVVESSYLENSIVDVRDSDKKSIDSIFEIINQALSQNAAEVRVEYNSQTGVPENIFIDRNRMIADEEILINTSDFRALELLENQLVLTEAEQDVLKDRFNNTVAPVGRTDFPITTFTGVVIDKDGDGKVSIGDIAKLRISGGNQSPNVENDIRDHVLSAIDIATIPEY